MNTVGQMGSIATVSDKIGVGNDEGSKFDSIFKIDSYSSSSFSSTNETEEDDMDSDFNDSLYELFKRMQLLGKDGAVVANQSVILEFPGKIHPKYYCKRYIKNTEISKSIPVLPTFQRVVITTDPLLSDGYVILTKNRASKIFYAIASAVFHSSESLMASQAKLMFLKQIEKDYAAAKKSNDSKEIRRCIHLVNKTVLEYDEPWFDQEWLIASKAFFAPVHILYSCRRVPSNPHVVRYQFSQVVIDEQPIRIVVDNGE